MLKGKGKEKKVSSVKCFYVHYMEPVSVQMWYKKPFAYFSNTVESCLRLYHNILPREPKWCREPFSNTVRPVLSGEPWGIATDCLIQVWKTSYPSQDKLSSKCNFYLFLSKRKENLSQTTKSYSQYINVQQV